MKNNIQKEDCFAGEGIGLNASKNIYDACFRSVNKRFRFLQERLFSSICEPAFTLAEVLITLSIVGVVAVLTIPGVVKNYKNRLYVTQLQKTASLVENAAKSMMNDERVDNFYETKALLSEIPTGEKDKDNKDITISGTQYFLDNYIKSSKKNCTNGTKKPCIGSQYKNLIGQSIFVADWKNYYCVQTVNGVALCMRDVSSSSIDYQNLNGLLLLIDVNGPAEPNITGRDLFVVLITKDGTLRDPNSVANCFNGSTIQAAGSGCYQSIIDADWKMEY